MTAQTFRERLTQRALLFGTFVKTPTSHTVEVLAGTGFDFVIIDQEHGPFDRVATDSALLAARAGKLPALVRVPSSAPHGILAALDDGATGVLVPHVSNGDLARSVAASTHYRGGKRGFSNTVRAGGYGEVGIWPHVDASDAATVALAAVETPDAIERVDEIAAVAGLDGLFIGRGDLTVSLGAPSPQSPPVRAAAERIAAAALAHGKVACAHVGGLDPEEFRWLRAIGVSVFVIASDQGLLRQAAFGTLRDFRNEAARQA